MLGRRQIREKVLQSLYAIESANLDEHAVKLNMLKAVNEIYDLYISLLNLIVDLDELANRKIESNKQKQIKTAADTNPNLKFVQNPVIAILKSNQELINYTEKNQQLRWDLLDSFPNKLLKAIQSSELYNNYMENANQSFAHHKEFLLALYEELIAPNQDLHDYLEEQKLHWSDDLHIANTMVYNTIKSLIPNSGSQIKLFKPFKNSEDKQLMLQMFNLSLQHQKETTKKIKETATNWDLDRIAKIDLLILKMALTEMYYIPNIPPKVSLNEYIELAKNYSTNKSKTFVNGILDKCLKQLAKPKLSNENSLDL